MPDSPAPIDLLREHRAYFVDESRKAKQAADAATSSAVRDPYLLREQIMQQFVQRIDVTLRDWA
ncbi:MAG: hypothetical protein ACJ8HI_07105 [Massilia sp.]